MKRLVTVTLELEVEDDAIVCRDDEEMYAIVKKRGGEIPYLKDYIALNFLDAFVKHDAGAYENICAYARQLGGKVKIKE